MLKIIVKSILLFSFLYSTVAISAPLQKIGDGEGQLNVVAWAGYLERGATVEAFDWVTGYEDNTGCKVNIKTAGTSDEMVALMNEGGFDIVTASGDASLRLIAGDKVQEINTDLIFEELKQFDPTKIEYKYLDREKELKEINVNEV